MGEEELRRKDSMRELKVMWRERMIFLRCSEVVICYFFIKKG